MDQDNFRVVLHEGQNNVQLEKINKPIQLQMTAIISKLKIMKL